MAVADSATKHEAVSLDEFLKAQEQATFVATIEEIRDRPECVKLTPWMAPGGCLCSAALEVPRDTIESVTPTGNTHYCCGKVLRVGEIRFKEGAKIAVEQVFAQIMQSASIGGLVGSIPFPYSSVQSPYSSAQAPYSSMQSPYSSVQPSYGSAQSPFAPGLSRI